MTAPAFGTDATDPAERRAAGRELRREVPRSSHADLQRDGRADPVALIDDQNRDRVPWLVPVRHGRMAQSPFTFFRGAARIMAADLARTPTTGLQVQLGGDAHLSNFGAYASPERTLVFDQNDFDETLPGPWEWDLKRLAASFVIAGQDRALDAERCRSLATAAVASYRQAMDRFAGLGVLDLWYDQLSPATIEQVSGPIDRSARKRLERFERKARGRTSLRALEKLAVEVDGRFQIRHDPPTLLRLRDVPEAEDDGVALEEVALESLEQYAASLPDDRAHLYRRFTPIDVGVKVVGVGSVGTVCLVVLLQGRDRDDPLFLQVKQATRSVLEDHLPPSTYDNHGRRVVEGQRLTQAASDIFLGWTQGRAGRHFYVRQLRDWKGSLDVDLMGAEALAGYAHLCGWMLARGHARTGDPAAIAGYLGAGDQADRAFASFAEAYAEVNRADHRSFVEAISSGRLPAQHGV